MGLELFPSLRHYGIGLYASHPDTGGFLAGGDSHGGSAISGIKGAEEYAATVKLLEPILENHGLTLQECALRWLVLHNLLGFEDKGDTVDVVKVLGDEWERLGGFEV